MSLAKAPMVPSTLHYAAAHAHPASKPTVPQRGGPRRLSSNVPKPLSVDSDSTETDNDEPTSPSEVSVPGESRRLDMANPDRPYNMWRDKSGTLVPLKNVLIPDGYKPDTTIPGRPWICPVRSCRRLFKAPVDFGNHFKGHHRGSRLNDNLDGTFSVVGTSNNTLPAVVVSRDPTNTQVTAEPLRPVYPRGMAAKSILWVKATEPDPNPNSVRKSADVDLEIMDVDADVALELAAEGRPYQEWWDETGQLVNMAGALIPDGYELDDTFPDRPWVCPVRSCRSACKFRKNLGYHFMNAHKSCSLNDNGDGTFSVVGSHNDAAPRVVSNNPPEPNETPPPPPRLPLYSLESRMADQLKDSATASRAASTGTSNDASTDVSGARSESAATHLWDHIRSLVPELSVSDGQAPEIAKLLRLPKLRDLNIIPGTLPSDLNQKQVMALAIQIVGELNPKACSECRRHDGPFDCCVSLPSDAAQHLYQWLATSSRACASCIARKNSSACSLRRLASAWEWSSKHGSRVNIDESAADLGDGIAADAEWSNELSGRRRSARLFLANGDGDEDGEGEESDDEPHPDEAEPRRTRLVTLKLTRSVANGRAAREPRVSAWEGNGATEKVLHMEDWEMDDGRVNAAGEALAFSSTYLTANQTVQVSQNINFQAITVTSGRVHHFSADPTKTRMCTLASGKLRVQVGGDDFVVGSQGIFKIVPGTACTVTNRCYMDLVLHVTSLRGGA
ncbi:uncharacterized protein B0H64DRAFT_44584 [Chaetomium fimeti]|uniref:C2H2-type domain-containing protein n=1 Tax=Chaetomium fimeti TaxID=1854472 RepID=A0AAE0H7N1_9PEZI|nr:hypothetical protein B0H64DRAFT_44584 [Chaetomium fimeti]